MRRCFQLALLGAGEVAPNPMVGAVLVYGNLIIGEGYHRKFGEAHAEVNCINSVADSNKHLIKESTLYVSFEPCSHFGKTPPCTDLIIQHQIKNVVIGCTDPFEKVNGSGIEKLRLAGIQVVADMLKEEALQVNKRFFTFHQKQRPYIILKWAQSNDHQIARDNFTRTVISNSYTNVLVHKWRSEEGAIMIGTNTAMLDDPALTTRLWPGKDPLRIVIDKYLRLPPELKILNDDLPAIILNTIKQEEKGIKLFYKAEEDNIIQATLNLLQQKNIISLVVEGGTVLLQSFIDAGLWDEARVITNSRLYIGKGIPAPTLKSAKMISNVLIGYDRVDLLANSRDTYGVTEE